MLEELRIRNFAVIENLTVRFGSGLNVITGETGAGKSIMIQALSGLIGERLDPTVIRSGAKQAVVEGVFHLGDEVLRFLTDHGIPAENPIIVRRLIGSGRAGYINDAPVTMRLLKNLGERIVELVGQHEHQSLLRIDNHRNYLDTYLGIEPQRVELARIYRVYLERKRAYEEAVRRGEELKERKELISYQLKELETADIKPGEEEILTRELNLLKSAEKRKAYISEILHYFYEGKDSAYDLLARVSELMEKLSLVDPAMERDAQQLKELLIQAEELGREISSYQERIEYSPERIDEVINRLDQIRRLKKKYGGIEAMEAKRKELKAALEQLENLPFDLEKRRAELDSTHRKLLEYADRLSKIRRQGGEKLAAEIEAMLKGLKMEARFLIRIEETELTPEGKDRVEFYIVSNPGEEPKPLRKVASGGELSRIILVMKSILAASDRIPIVIFDEIDTGIGGRVGEVVGLRLSELARHHQIICITHLPQIAKFADHHFLVEKEKRKGMTYSWLKPLDQEERVVELARMIGGKTLTRAALKKAREMIEEAKCLRSQT